MPTLIPEKTEDFYYTILVIIFNIAVILYNVYRYRKKYEVNLSDIIISIIASPILAPCALLLLIIFIILMPILLLPTLKRK